MSRHDFVEEEIGKIKRIRRKTFGEKLGDFIGGCIVGLLILGLIGAFIDDDPKQTPDTVKETPFRNHS